jgi:uncharacterized coiled-coil DUF342 family protein
MNEQEQKAEQEKLEYEAFVMPDGCIAIVHAKGTRLMTVRHYTDELNELVRQRNAVIKERDEARAEAEKLKEQILEDQNRCNPYVSLTTQKDLDQVRAEVEKLKAELNKAEKAWLYWENKAKSNSMKLRPEPSRLEIAAMILAGGCANPELATNEYVALAQADALIAAAKEEPCK